MMANISVAMLLASAWTDSWINGRHDFYSCQVMLIISRGSQVPQYLKNKERNIGVCDICQGELISSLVQDLK